MSVYYVTSEQGTFHRFEGDLADILAAQFAEDLAAHHKAKHVQILQLVDKIRPAA